MIKLRDYQESAVKSVYNYWSKKIGKNPLIVAPTGAGKSLIIAQLCKDMVRIKPRVRILIATHKVELIRQNKDELGSLAPEIDTGVFSAGIGIKDYDKNILFAGVQSISSKITSMDPFDVLIIDEAHLIPKKSETRYGQMIKYLEMMNPKIKCIGLTATPYRLDSGPLFGKSHLFDGISYEIQVSKLIEAGYLSPVISKGGVEKIDLSCVKKRGGEYVESDLSRAASSSKLVDSVVREIIDLGRGRRSWLVFSSGISHAELLKEKFKERGLSVTLLTGKTPKKERERIVSDFKDNKIKCLINVGVLTTGFNAPVCDLIAMVRATLSTSLYVQIVGRGMRCHPGKKNVLFLDYGHNVVTHGPIDAIPIPRNKSESLLPGECPQKECPNCNGFCNINTMECPECGHEFIKDEVSANHDSRAYSGAVMKSQIKPEVYNVTNVIFRRHKKSGCPDSVKVTYFSGVYTFNEWIPIESFQGKDLARKKIKDFGGNGETVSEVLSECRGYKTPEKISIIKKNKWAEIVSKEFVD